MSEPTQFEEYNSKVDFDTLPEYTLKDLKHFDGIKNPKVYVLIRGIVFDVTSNEKLYAPGKSYHRLTGKDITRLLGFNRFELKIDEAEEGSLLATTWYADDLDDKQNAIIDQWIVFFKKRYNIVAKVDLKKEEW